VARESSSGGRPTAGWRAGMGARALQQTGRRNTGTPCTQSVQSKQTMVSPCFPPAPPGRRGSRPLREMVRWRVKAAAVGVRRRGGGRAWEPWPRRPLKVDGWKVEG